MPKKANGFLCADGSFFNTENEADYHETRTELISCLIKEGISEDAIDWIDKLQNPLMEYLYAKEALQKDEERNVSNENLPGEL